MNKKISTLLILSYSSFLLAADDNNQDKYSAREKIDYIYKKGAEQISSVANKIHQKSNDTWQSIKNRWNNVVDELTQQSAHEIKQEIIEQLKNEPAYNKAMMANSNDLISWYFLKGFQLPKHATKALYTHCIAGQKKLKSWQRAISLVNKELNDAYDQAQKAK